MTTPDRGGDRQDQSGGLHDLSDSAIGFEDAHYREQVQSVARDFMTFEVEAAKKWIKAALSFDDAKRIIRQLALIRYTLHGEMDFEEIFADYMGASAGKDGGRMRMAAHVATETPPPTPSLAEVRGLFGGLRKPQSEESTDVRPKEV